jgi:hypothetical protein
LQTIVLIASFLVYIWGYYVVLLCYREFKALMKSGQIQGGVGMAAMGGGGRGGNGGGYRMQPAQDAGGNGGGNNGGGFNAFGGQGVTIG